MILSELIARIKQVAIDTSKGPIDPKVMDSEVLIELILPRALQIVTTDILESPEGFNSFRRTITLAFTTGSAPVPAGLKEEYIPYLVFEDLPDASYIEDWFTFQTEYADDDALVARAPYTVPRFTFKDKKIYLYGSGAIFGSITASLNVIAIVVPTLPAAAADTVDIRDDFLQRMIAFTASVVNGTIPISALGIANITEEDQD